MESNAAPTIESEARFKTKTPRAISRRGICKHVIVTGWCRGPHLTPEKRAEWQRELFAVVDELAELERWPADAYDLIAGQIERQPVSTIRPDLTYFRVQLERVKLESRERKQRAAGK